MHVLTTTLRALWWKLCLVVLAACGSPLTRVELKQGQTPAVEVVPTNLLVNLTGKLGTVELARCHRTLREAEARGCGYVIFVLRDAGSLGEDPDEVQSLLDRIQHSPVKTVAVLGGRVTEGAAAIALCTTRTLCLPSAQWGEVMNPEKQVADYLNFSGTPEEAIARRIDALRAAMKMRLDRREPKLRPEALTLAMAIVDPRVQLVEATVRQGGVERTQLLDQAELAALQASGAKVFGDRPLVKPLYASAQEAEQYGLSGGTLQQLDDLADVLTIDRATLGELSTNWAESMVGWLEILQPFLLVVGLLLLLIEVKTPGVGLPGLLGVCFLGLAMFYSYLVGLAEVTEIIVFFLGLAAIAVEIFVLPGMVVFGAVGFLCLVLSLILSRQSFVLPSNAIEDDILLHNLTHLTLLFLLVLVLGALLWRVLPRVPFFNRVMLPAPQPVGGGSTSGLGLGDARLAALVGRRGLAVTVLRPTGTMEIDGERFDVVTDGEFVEAGTAVRVIEVAGTRVIVAADGGAAADTTAGQRGTVGVVLLLLVVGLALLVAEVLFVSFGIIGTVAGATLIGAVFVAFQESFAFGVTTLVVEAIAAPIVLALSFRLLPKTRIGRQLILEPPTQTRNPATDEAPLVSLLHKTGVALTPLRPAGMARIDGHKVDVVTRGDMIEPDSPVVVLEVAGNRVVVGKVATKS